jgi:hypothetical protein
MSVEDKGSRARRSSVQNDTKNEAKIPRSRSVSVSLNDVGSSYECK